MTSYQRELAGRQDRALGKIKELFVARATGKIDEAEFLEKIERLYLAQAALTERQKLRAETDALTRLPNRRSFLEDISGFCQFCSANKLLPYVAILDIDHFKIVNDTHGHDVGDRVLKRVAQIIVEGTRINDWVARLRTGDDPEQPYGRYGGEEFGIGYSIPTEQGDEGAHAAVENLRLRISAQQITVGVFKNINVTASIGIARIQGADYPSALKNADKALYQAKVGGRNRVVVFEG